MSPQLAPKGAATRQRIGVVVMLSTGRIDHLEAALDVGIGNLRASGNR